MNYELILSLAPPETQILLLSGSVANPEDVVTWLQRIGRNVALVEHQERPVRLEEVMLNDIPVQAPGVVNGYWPRLISRALIADLGPLLIFAPRRNAAEELAQSLSGALAIEEPMSISQEQAAAAGEPLAKLLRHRVAYHHSGLSYAVRAGIIEPLAKRGQLRVVVATMGLAAGINFSMRSVLVAGTHYMAGNFQRQVRPDELLQMFGRAGRRGLDEAGYALVTPEVPRLHEAFPLKLKRPEPIDWPSFLAVMNVAAARGEDPFLSALELSRRLFSSKNTDARSGALLRWRLPPVRPTRGWRERTVCAAAPGRNAKFARTLAESAGSGRDDPWKSPGEDERRTVATGPDRRFDTGLTLGLATFARFRRRTPVCLWSRSTGGCRLRRRSGAR